MGPNHDIKGVVQACSSAPFFTACWAVGGVKVTVQCPSEYCAWVPFIKTGPVPNAFWAVDSPSAQHALVSLPAAVTAGETTTMNNVIVDEEK